MTHREGSAAGFGADLQDDGGGHWLSQPRREIPASAGPAGPVCSLLAFPRVTSGVQERAGEPCGNGVWEGASSGHRGTPSFLPRSALFLPAFALSLSGTLTHSALRVYVWCWAWPLPRGPGAPPCGCPRSWGGCLSARKSPAFSPGICHLSPGGSGLLTSSLRSVPNLMFLPWPFLSPICARPFSRHVRLSRLPTVCLGLADRVPSGPE